MIRAWVAIELINGQTIKYVRDALVDSSGGSIQTIAINNGGINYVSGDIGKLITVSTGGSGGKAVITSVSSAGAITGLSLVEPGSGYTAAAGTATTGGTGSGLTVNTTIGIGTGQVSTLAQVAGSVGTGYVTSDIVGLAPALGGGFEARATVTAAAGAITGLALLTPGYGYKVGQVYSLVSLSGVGVGALAKITAVVNGNGMPRQYYAYDGISHIYETENGSAGQIRNDFATIITNYETANKYLLLPDAYTPVPVHVYPMLSTSQPAGRGLYNYNYIASAYVARIYVAQEWYDVTGTGILSPSISTYQAPIDGPFDTFH